MAPPQRQRSQHVELSDAEFAQLQRYAKANGLTVDAAATQLARAALVGRYRLRRIASAKVLPLRRR